MRKYIAAFFFLNFGIIQADAGVVDHTGRTYLSKEGKISIIREDQNLPGRERQLYSTDNEFKGYYIDHCIKIIKNDSTTQDPYHPKTVAAHYKNNMNPQDIDLSRSIDFDVLVTYADKTKVSIYQIHQCKKALEEFVRSNSSQIRSSSTQDEDRYLQSFLMSHWFPKNKLDDLHFVKDPNGQGPGCNPHDPPPASVPIPNLVYMFGAIAAFILLP